MPFGPGWGVGVLLDEIERLRVNLAHAQNVAVANSEWITAVCTALDMSVEIEPPDAAAWVARLRDVEQRAIDVHATGGRDEVLSAARYILNGETR